MSDELNNDFDWIKDTNPIDTTTPFIVELPANGYNNIKHIDGVIEYLKSLVRMSYDSWPVMSDLEYMSISAKSNNADTIYLFIEDGGISWITNHGDYMKYIIRYDRIYRIGDIITYMPNDYKIMDIKEEIDDFDWIRGIQPTISFNEAEVDQIYRVHSVNGETMKESFENCGDWPDGLIYEATASDVEEYFKGMVVEVRETKQVSLDSVMCNDSTEMGVGLQLLFGTDFLWWCHEDMVTIGWDYDNINESDDDGLGWMDEIKPSPMGLYFGRTFTMRKNNNTYLIKGYDEKVGNVIITLHHNGGNSMQNRWWVPEEDCLNHIKTGFWVLTPPSSYLYMV